MGKKRIAKRMEVGAFGLSHMFGGAATYPPGARLRERVMGDFEFVWIQRGRVVYHLEGKEFGAGPGTVLLARPGFRESYTWDKEGATRHAYFHFTMGELPAGLPGVGQWAVMREMGAGDVIRPLFAFVVANLPGRVEEAVLPTVVRAVETMLWAFVVGPWGQVSEEVGLYPEPVHRAIAFAGRRLAEDPAAGMGLEDLAAAAAVSGKHLCRLFAGALSTTPMRVVLGLRLRHAVELLGRTDLKLEVVARQCGFKTLYHFSRRCRDFYGVAPSELRRQMARGKRGVLSGPMVLGGGAFSVDY